MSNVPNKLIQEPFKKLPSWAAAAAVHFGQISQAALNSPTCTYTPPESKHAQIRVADGLHKVTSCSALGIHQFFLVSRHGLSNIPATVQPLKPYMCHCSLTMEDEEAVTD